MKKCKECNESKELTEFYSHPRTRDGTLSRCKECVKAWRRSSRERELARKNDAKRSKKPERLKYSQENTKRFREQNPEKWKAQMLVNNFFKKFPHKKPKKSTVSWKDWWLHMHHHDYSKPFEIIPCTPLEHRAFHNGSLDVKPEYIVRLK